MLRPVLAGLALVLASGAPAHAADRVSVADPAGGPRWTAQQQRDGSRTCVAVRRGTRAPSRTCARLTSRQVFAYDVRRDAGTDPRSARTVLVASFAPNVESARLVTPDGTRTYRRRKGRPRVLLAVLAGHVERPPLTVRARLNGKLKTARSVPEPAVQVADPLGGAAWRTRIAAASGGAACVAWERVQPRFEDAPQPSRGAARCGDPDDLLPVSAAQVVDGRLVVFGLAGRPTDRLTLRLPDGRTRVLAFERVTRAWLAVLPGTTDPAALAVTAVDGDRVVEQPPRIVG